jgi:hypothetical protein
MHSSLQSIMAAEETGELCAPQFVPIGGRGQVDDLVSDKGTTFYEAV